MKKETSADECSDFYGGPYAFSEPETKLLSNFLMDSRRNIELFISLNGYGQRISYSSNGMSLEKIDSMYDLARAGTRYVKTTKAKAAKYIIDVRSKRSGSADQFAMHNAKIRYSYNFETRDDPTNGFFVPATSIEENAREMFEIISGMVKNI